MPSASGCARERLVRRLALACGVPPARCLAAGSALRVVDDATLIAECVRQASGAAALGCEALLREPAGAESALLLGICPIAMRRLLALGHHDLGTDALRGSAAALRAALSLVSDLPPDSRLRVGARSLAPRAITEAWDEAHGVTMSRLEAAAGCAWILPGALGESAGLDYCSALLRSLPQAGIGAPFLRTLRTLGAAALEESYLTHLRRVRWVGELADACPGAADFYLACMPEVLLRLASREARATGQASLAERVRRANSEMGCILVAIRRAAMAGGTPALASRQGEVNAIAWELRRLSALLTPD
ncbi:hypothetical protein J2T57_001321 [Natronocella acetinitrilica]|uniref:Uncharacterized protein n=1 Tax=Natronocella acetinitrilica TaxID=414046 RepID=A0AAE3G376_9GAMM|nr:hypothetical protein [Natronocella acetinitrilica]MCP1674219.1 hypothetical protein [Natronocella acetinitrilica]